MDLTSPSNQGQSDSPPLSENVHMLCELVQFIRAWWNAFEDSLRQLDRAAATKAHDAIVDAVILARSIARAAGVVLPDFNDYNWAATRPPAGRFAADL